MAMEHADEERNAVELPASAASTPARLIEELRHHQCELKQQNEELRRTYDELNRITARFRDLWDDAPVGYLSHERNGVIIAANSRARELLQAIAPVRDQSTLQSFLTPASRLIFRQHMSCVLESQKAVAAALQLATKPECPEIWVRVESTSTATSEFRSALVDISAEKRAEAERQSLARQLWQSQKMEVMHEMSAGIAHDFNNVLQVVIAHAELLRDEIGSRGGSLADLESLLRGARHGADLTRRLLAFSRKSTLQPRTNDLNQIARNVVAVMERTVREQITVERSFCPESLLVDVDAALIEQAILNLCLNARDAMPRGGVLTVATGLRQVSDAAVMHGCRIDVGRYAVVMVSDTGIGMDESVRQQMFQPFFTTKSSGSGTGLGLSIVYGTVRQHQGAVDVESTSGAGTCFSLYLPLSDTELPPISGPHSSHAASAARRGMSGTILLAEDNSAIRGILQSCLQREGYQVLTASDGRQAIELVQADPTSVDLLLTDIAMPRASGRDVCAAFLKERPGAPVIFLTGHADGVMDRDFLSQHRAQLLAKPVSSEQLLDAVAARMTGGAGRLSADCQQALDDGNTGCQA